MCIRLHREERFHPEIASTRPSFLPTSHKNKRLTSLAVFLQKTVEEVRRMMRQNSGYTLVEILTVVALTTFGSSMAVVQLKNSINWLDADRAANTVSSQLRYAREIAVDQRRNVRVDFISPATIKLTRLESGGGSTVISTTALPSGYTFSLPTGVGDTPDGYGNATAVYFNNANSGTFLSDGSFVDPGGIALSGSVFTISSGNASARATTLAGATGRTKQYFIKDLAWTERK